MFTLPLWEGSWPDGADGCKGYLSRILAPVNLFLSPVPLGALMGIRMDWTPISLTPVGLLRSAAARLYPAAQTPAMDSRREALHGDD